MSRHHHGHRRKLERQALRNWRNVTKLAEKTVTSLWVLRRYHSDWTPLMSIIRHRTRGCS